MKNRNIILPATILILLIVSWMNPGNAHPKKEEHAATTTAVQATPYSVIPPEIPEKTTFAGTEICLTAQERRERIDRELLSFCYSHINTTLQIKRANRIFPIIEPILKECGIPDDLKYLMIIESNGDIEARSPVGAGGLWQFMESTGKEYGLEINKEVDERFNIAKATRAACKYLNDSYEIYGDWLTVAASYNTGRTNINKRIAGQKENEAINMVLSPETSRYIYRLMAAKIIFEKPSDYGFILKSSDLYPQIKYTETTIDKSVASWADFAKEYGLTYLQLRESNPWIRGTALTNKTNKRYKVLVPDVNALHYDPSRTKAHNANWVTE